jgi:hypothetical protein
VYVDIVAGRDPFDYSFEDCHALFNHARLRRDPYSTDNLRLSSTGTGWGFFEDWRKTSRVYVRLERQAPVAPEDVGPPYSIANSNGERAARFQE